MRSMHAMLVESNASLRQEMRSMQAMLLESNARGVDLRNEVTSIRAEMRSMQAMLLERDRSSRSRSRYEMTNSRPGYPRHGDVSSPAWLKLGSDGKSLTEREMEAMKRIAPDGLENFQRSLQDLVREHALPSSDKEHQRDLRIVAAMIHMKGLTKDKLEEELKYFQKLLEEALKALSKSEASKQKREDMKSSFLLAAKRRMELPAPREDVLYTQRPKQSSRSRSVP